MSTHTLRKSFMTSGPRDTIYGAFNNNVIVEEYDLGETEPVRYIFAVMNLDPEVLVAAVDEIPGALMHVFQTTHISGAFVDIENTLILVVSAPNGDLVNDYEIFNQSMDARINDEVRHEARSRGLANFQDYGHLVFRKLLWGYYSVLARLNNTSLDKVETKKAVNSFAHLIDNHKKLIDGNYFDARHHLQFFSWIYYVEMRLIAEIMPQETAVKVHDVATNTAFFPMLLSSLNDEATFGVNFQNITCSDIELDVVRNSISAISDKATGKHKEITLLQLDLTHDNEILEDADVIVANDILEHFPEDISFQVLQNIWRRTRKYLIIHVPFEDVPTEAYGHFSNFNKEKLHNWAERLERCKNITADYAYVATGNGNPNFIDEFLFLEKREG